jgi:hypothetical protein
MNKIDAAVEYLRDNSGNYAVAEAQLVYMTELRKTVKAQLMKQFELQGHKTTAAQEREAYADPKYVQHLTALQAAVEQREKARWLMIAAQARVEAEKANLYANGRTDRAMQ